jgi:hypothetical protein
MLIKDKQKHSHTDTKCEEKRMTYNIYKYIYNPRPRTAKNAITNYFGPQRYADTTSHSRCLNACKYVQVEL